MKEDGWGLSYIYDQIVSKLDRVKDINVYAELDSCYFHVEPNKQNLALADLYRER